MKNYEKLKLASVVRNSIPRSRFSVSDENLERFKTFNQIVMSVLAVTGMATMAVVAPNALQALDVFLDNKGKKGYTRKSRETKLVKAIYYLKGKGFVHLQQTGDSFDISLTKEGKQRYEELCEQYISVPKPEKWDGKFWQVAADIPTRHRIAADSFRRKIKAMKFYSLQRTLWYHPFDPRAEVLSLAQDFGIEQYVTVMKVEMLDPQDLKVISEHFKLNRII